MTFLRIVVMSALAVWAMMETYWAEGFKREAHRAISTAAQAAETAEHAMALCVPGGHDYSHCATIHRPPAGCPAGYREVADVFERDGRTYPACERPPDREHEDCTDVLYPHESMRVSITVR